MGMFGALYGERGLEFGRTERAVAFTSSNCVGYAFISLNSDSVWHLNCGPKFAIHHRQVNCTEFCCTGCTGSCACWELDWSSTVGHFCEALKYYCEAPLGCWWCALCPLVCPAVLLCFPCCCRLSFGSSRPLFSCCLDPTAWGKFGATFYQLKYTLFSPYFTQNSDPRSLSFSAVLLPLFLAHHWCHFWALSLYTCVLILKTHMLNFWYVFPFALGSIWKQRKWWFTPSFGRFPFLGHSTLFFPSSSTMKTHLLISWFVNTHSLSLLVSETP